MMKFYIDSVYLACFFWAFCFGATHLQGQERSEPFEFTFEDKVYSGLIDYPEGEPNSLIILIPGSGRTNMVEGNWYYEDLQTMFVEQGLAVMVYDKAGCGKSEGAFDYNQSVQNSSLEVLAAIAELREQKIPGSDQIGLWSHSRGGWIAPLVIQQDPEIAYWISASGPDHLETIGYFFEANWRVQGRSEEEIELLYAEWLAGFTIQRKGGTYEEYLAASPNVKKDSMMLALRGGKFNTEEKFYSFQKVLEGESFDEETGLTIIVPDFAEVLSEIKCPVLAVFGEKDSQVHWQRSLALYQKTIGENDLLTYMTLPDGNHFLLSCETGGYLEKISELRERGLGQPCEGYYPKIQSWLSSLGYSH
ncbi:MAG: alpha/beta hydrolase [Bacteroidota bacterium]